MVKDLSVANKYAEITPGEKEILASNAKPIVLVKKKKLEKASP